MLWDKGQRRNKHVESFGLCELFDLDNYKTELYRIGLHGVISLHCRKINKIDQKQDRNLNDSIPIGCD